MRDEGQGPRGRVLRILLPQRSGGGVTRVRVLLLSRLTELDVELRELLEGKEHLASDLHDFRPALALELNGDGANGLCVGSHVLAGHAVPASSGHSQSTALVSQIERQPIDLRLRRNRKVRR